MKNVREYEKDLASIRTMMERSAKFISLSGLSGILAGVYALAGAGVAYTIIPDPLAQSSYESIPATPADSLVPLLVVAAAVFVASIATGMLLSSRQAKKHGVKFWTSSSQRLLINVAIPVVTGGIFIFLLLLHGHYHLAAPASLIFYGLALLLGSANTFDEIRYLGFCQIILGLIATYFSGYGLIFWALGFGVLHIVYGVIMYNKYDKQESI